MVSPIHARAQIFIRGSRAHQITAQPSASWKLSAISVPFCSVQTINVSDRVIQSANPVFVSGEMTRRWWDRNLVVFGSHRPWRS